MTSAGHQSYLDTPILQLIEESAVSVRLSNALRAALELPLQTVGEYLNAGEDAKFRFMRLQNLGRKSADELEDLIQAFAREPRPLSVAPESDLSPSVPAGPTIQERLAELFERDLYPSVFLDNGVPKRLETCLADEESRPLSEVFLVWQTSCAALLGRHNVGRQSIVDLSTIALDHIRRRLRGLGFTPADIAAAAPVILMASTPTAEAASALETRLDVLQGHVPLPEEPDPVPLGEVVSSSFEILNERERDVLARRYGYPAQEIETLEAISVGYAVTRERIRQIESKALRKLSIGNVKRKFEAAFAAEKAFIPERLHRGDGYVIDDGVYRAFQALPSIDRIAIDVLYEDRSELLEELATHWKGGWLFSPLEPEALNNVAKELKEAAASMPFPNTLERVVGPTPSADVMAALRLATGLSTFEGYVADNWFGPRLKRTVRLHRKLCGANAPLDVRELVANYHKSYPNDLCSVRDAIIVMCAAPHLFVELQDGIWAGVGEAPHDDRGPEENIAVELPAADFNEPSAQTIRAGLRDILRQHGPLRFVDLRGIAVDTLGQKHAHSIGPILLTSGTFVRPLPGVYALQDQLPDLQAVAFDPPAFVRNEEQAKWLAMARFAGEPFGSFPLWQPEVEYALCRWGETKASPLVWQSLLAVASVQDWPVSEREREHWRDLQVRHGVYDLMSPMRYPIRQLWPPLHRLLAAMHILKMRGSINWVVANRLLKRRIDAHAAPALLGILCLLGFVSAPPHWQMPHNLRELPDSLMSALSWELQQSGKLTWESAVGSNVVAMLSTRIDLPENAWLNSTLVAELRSVAHDDPADSLAVAADVDDDAVSFEQLLEEVSRQQRLADIKEDISAAAEET